MVVKGGSEWFRYAPACAAQMREDRVLILQLVQRGLDVIAAQDEAITLHRPDMPVSVALRPVVGGESVDAFGGDAKPLGDPLGFRHLSV
jgi:hypothetical protein